MAKIKVRLIGPLAQLAGGVKELEVEATIVKDAVQVLCEKLGEEFKKRVIKEGGELQNFVRLFLNERDIRFLNGINTELKDGDIILLVPAIGGG